MNYIDSAYIIDYSRDESLKLDTSVHSILCDMATEDIDTIAGYFEKNANGRKFPRVGKLEEVPVSVKIATLSQVEYLYSNQPDAIHGVRSDDETSAVRQFSPRAFEIMQKAGYTRRCGKIIFEEL